MQCVTERTILAADPKSVHARLDWGSPFNLLKLSAKSTSLFICFFEEESPLFT